MAAMILVSAVLFATFLMVVCSSSISEANEILVGGKKDAWKIPTSDSDSLNAWAASARFRIGDSLVWTYDGGKDSVLQVTRENYLNCNTSTPIKEYTGGNTTVKLDKSGPHYFISGAQGHCTKGEKLIVVVLTPRSHNQHHHLGLSPAPSPTLDAPAVAPIPTSASSVTPPMLPTGLGVLLLLPLL